MPAVSSRRHRLYDVDAAVASLRAILDWCLRRGADTMLFVVRTPFESNAVGPARTFFGARIRAEFLACGWPGTVSLKKDNLVIEVAFDEELAQLVIEREPRLVEWREHNLLPEDPCVFRRGDGWPLFYSITPEEIAWIVSDVPVDIPGVAPSVERMTREFIFSDRSFCKTEE